MNPISWLFSRKHCLQMFRPYFLIRPAVCAQTRLERDMSVLVLLEKISCCCFSPAYVCSCLFNLPASLKSVQMLKLVALPCFVLDIFGSMIQDRLLDSLSRACIAAHILGVSLALSRGRGYSGKLTILLNPCRSFVDVSTRRYREPWLR